MIRFFLLLLLLLIVPDLFIWWNYTRQQDGALRTVLVFLPSVVTALLMITLLCHHRASWLLQAIFILIICIAVPKFTFFLVAGIGKLFSLNTVGVPLLATRLGVTFAVLTAGVQIFGSVKGWKHLFTDRHELYIRNLPKAFEGYRIVQLTDLHLGTYADDTTFIATLVDSVNSLRPDAIVFTGDLINIKSDEVLPYIRTLSRLQAKDGVYSVLGNHDYNTYHPGISPAEQANEVKRLLRMEKEMGWKVLNNEHAVIQRLNDRLYIAGVENIGKPPFPEKGNLARALHAIPDEATTVLLSHDPWHWRNGVVRKTDVQLTLSGHTHALQMQVGRFSPAAWFISEWGGLYREGDQQLYVSTGIGGSVPYRLGAWPKIELFELKAE